MRWLLVQRKWIGEWDKWEQDWEPDFSLYIAWFFEAWKWSTHLKAFMTSIKNNSRVVCWAFNSLFRSELGWTGTRDSMGQRWKQSFEVIWVRSHLCHSLVLGKWLNFSNPTCKMGVIIGLKWWMWSSKWGLCNNYYHSSYSVAGQELGY